MTMEERSSGIEDGAPVISTGGTINSSSSLNSPRTKACEMTTDASYPLQRPGKRSFDVAFLVAPDEKLIRRQTEKLVSLQYCTSRLMSDALRQQSRPPVQDELSDDSSREIERSPQNMTIKHFESIEASKYKSRRAEEARVALPLYSPPRRRPTPTSVALPPEPPAHLFAGSLRVQKSPSPPGAFQPGLQHASRKLFADENSCDQSLALAGPDRLASDSRSAFTKVNLAAQRPGGVGPSPKPVDDASPRSSVSPDVLAYQSSLSPPIGGFNGKGSFPGKPPYPFLLEPAAQQSPQSPQQQQQQPAAKPPSPGSFRPELPAAVYPNLAYNPLVFPPTATPRFLAASLLPSSFAALALPAQNVCAKCNLSFRMTSDLVYHMRSHHKNENTNEAARRRREDKLRCPVCDESFRERHHLTRHMTAHQDKESDALVDHQAEIKRRSATGAATLLHGK